jgi:nucleotidyltransferase/DNA polymerase involved in DNA repair
MSTHLIAHVDMDCFFAACEIKRNPRLANLPLIVGAHKDSTRGVICTASYEARSFGVHSAMPITQAVRACPHGIFVPPDIRYYREESTLVMDVLRSITSSFEQVGIDEGYLDVTELAKTMSLLDIGRLIRKKVYEQVGYTCSVGISNSRRVSKIASDYKKPHGVTAVYKAKQFLAKLVIKKIPGIGKKSIPTYHQHNIFTIDDLANTNKMWFIDTFGKHAISYWNLANGLDTSGLRTEDAEKSSSRETTFDIDQNNQETVLSHLVGLARRVYADVKGISYKTVSIKVRYNNFVTITRSFTLRFASTNLGDILQTVKQLFFTHVDFTKPVRLIGVRVSQLFHNCALQTKLTEYFLPSNMLADAAS